MAALSVHLPLSMVCKLLGGRTTGAELTCINSDRVAPLTEAQEDLPALREEVRRVVSQPEPRCLQPR